MADGYKNKLRSSILTNAGRQTFLQVGNGVGTLVYTRAILTSQTMNDSNGNPLDNEIIAGFSNLSDDLKDGKLQITPVTGNHFEVIANFDNKNQAQDIVFRAIGWYARIDTKNGNGQTVKGPEKLIAVSPTTNESEVLAAGSPDGLSTQVISAALDMTISNAANRITSTYVENTIFPSVTMAVFQDHLHIRGEYRDLNRNKDFRAGSPPHTWRIPVLQEQSYTRLRITSTYVENTPSKHRWQILG